MNFCKMCGAPIKQAAAPAPAYPAYAPTPPSPAPFPTPPAGFGPPPAAAPGNFGLPSPAAVSGARAPSAAPPASSNPANVAPRSCTACGGSTPMGFAFCQHCGARLPAAPQAQGLGVAETLAVDNLSKVGARASAPPAAGGVVGGVIGSPPSAPAPAPFGVSTVRDNPAGPAAQAWGKLVAVHRDGSDGDAFHLTSDQTDLGRSEGEITFSSDRFLASRHARVERKGAQVVVRPLERTNGVYIKVVDPLPLSDGDTFLLGKEVFRYDSVPKEERDAQPSVQHGTWLFASPARAPWGRLSQVIVSGVVRDVYYLSRNEVVLGREDGDFRFPDDEFMSRRHAKVSQTGGKVELADLGSSNGTYLRLRDARPVKSGDMIRIGDQLFRFEQL